MNGIWLPYCNSISKLKLIVMNVFSLLREKLENANFSVNREAFKVKCQVVILRNMQFNKIRNFQAPKS